MRIVTEKRIVQYAVKHPNASASLYNFVSRMKHGRFNNIAELRNVFPSADQVTVRSGRTVIVFNIAGNHHRLIASCHYNTQLIFVLKIMTHAEYSKKAWKEDL